MFWKTWCFPVKFTCWTRFSVSLAVFWQPSYKVTFPFYVVKDHLNWIAGLLIFLYAKYKG